MIEEARFTWLDYFLFISMLVISALVGVYYGFIKKQNTANDYLLGGKEMTILPTAMSIVSSSLSGLVLLSLPADIYRYGITYWLPVALLPIVIVIGYYVYIPVFYKLQVTSTYEYLNLRFDSRVRTFASVLFTIQMVLFLPIVIYVPAIALEQATGINSHFITPIVCGVCIFYTTLGGLKAVVWTDAIQFVVMVGALFVVMVIGIITCGGFQTIFEKAYAGGRLDISLELSLIKRDTFWSAVIAAMFMFNNHFNCNQSFVQKCLSLPSYKNIKIALILATIGTFLIMTFSIFTGLVMYAKYSDCDPLERKVINNHDQLIPMYVMEEANFLPGLPGLFISGIFSAALSTLSAAMNCLAATVYEDFISPFVSKDTSQKTISLYLKLLVVFIGIFSTACVYIVERLGSLLPLAFSFAGVTSGPLSGLFTVGMLIPMVNAKGALYGGITSLLVMTWIIMTTQWYSLNKIIVQPMLPLSTRGCNDTIANMVNETLLNMDQSLVSTTETTVPETPFVIYRISFFWYTLMGFLIVVIVSVLMSCITKEDKPLNKDCICPLIHPLLKSDHELPPRYDTIEKALKIVNKI